MHASTHSGTGPSQRLGRHFEREATQPSVLSPSHGHLCPESQRATGARDSEEARHGTCVWRFKWGGAVSDDLCSEQGQLCSSGGEGGGLAHGAMCAQGLF